MRSSGLECSREADRPDAIIQKSMSRAISAVPDGPPLHQRSCIRLQCGSRARSQWLCAVWGTSYNYQQLCVHHGVDGLMSYYSYSFSGALFVRIRIDYSYHYSVPKRIRSEYSVQPYLLAFLSQHGTCCQKFPNNTFTRTSV